MYDLVTELQLGRAQSSIQYFDDDRRFKQQYKNLHRFYDETDKIIKEKIKKEINNGN